MNPFVILVCSIPYEVRRSVYQAIESDMTLGILITVASWILFKLLFPRDRNIGLLTVLGLQSAPYLLAQRRNDFLDSCGLPSPDAAQDVLNTGLLLFVLLVLSASLLATLALVEDGRLDWLKRHFYWLRPKNI